MSRIAWLRTRLAPSYLLGESPVATWLRGAGWIFGSSLIERGAALVQTILIARAIGEDDYGRYALLLSTIALAAPLVSLQLAYSVIAIVSRTAERDPERASAAVVVADRVIWGFSLLFLAVCIGWPAGLSQWLLGLDGNGWAIVMTGVILVAAVRTGLNDALLQTKQEFRTLAIARTWTSAAAFVPLILVALIAPSLNNVMTAMAAANLLRLFAVSMPARRHRRALFAGITSRRAWTYTGAILSFSVPVGLLSVLQGGATWLGNYVLSRSPSGFVDLAIVNTGVQWRLPVMMVLGSLSTAILPMLGASVGASREGEAQRLQRYNMLVNLGLATLFCAGAVVASELILALYGPGFRGNGYLFSLVIVALIPTAYWAVHQQLLVARGTMWTQLWLFIPYALVTIGGTLWFREEMTGETLAYIQLAAWTVAAIAIGIWVRFARPSVDKSDRVGE